MDNNGNNPNWDILRLQVAENTVGQAVESLCELVPTNDTQSQLKDQCISTLLNFQSEELLALRRVFE